MTPEHMQQKRGQRLELITLSCSCRRARPITALYAFCREVETSSTKQDRSSRRQVAVSRRGFNLSAEGLSSRTKAINVFKEQFSSMSALNEIIDGWRWIHAFAS